MDSTVLYTSQGTVLDLPLYNGSTHDIDNSDISTTLSTYADDNNPLVAGCNSADNARKLLVRSVTNLTQETCFSMFRNLPRICVSFSIILAVRPYIKVEGIEVNDDLKVLGFTIDSNFNFSKHIDKAVKKSNSILFSIWRLCKIGSSKDVIASLYRAFFSQSFTMALMFGVVQMLMI